MNLTKSILGSYFKKGVLSVILISLIIAAAFAITILGPEKGFIVVAGIIGVAVGFYSLVNFVFGFYAAIFLGFFIFFIGRLMGQAFPSGYLVDGLILASFLGLIIHKTIKREPFLHNAHHVITYGYFLFTLFLIAQVFNPHMESIDGWVFVVRKFLQFVIIFFLALNVFINKKSVQFFFTFWIVMAFIAGVYGCYQEWMGFFDFELNWVWSVPGRAGLYFLDNGMMRKFSILSDPAAYGITMASTNVFLFILTVFAKKRNTKILLIVANIFILLGGAYSGTRTAYFVIAAGVVLYSLLTITNRNTLIFACAFLMGFVFIIYGPIYGNTTINRIRTTFTFKEDASLNVRDENRKYIQPYIHKNPIGGGLATSGMPGMEYNPNHFLAGFPPDSGFLKTAVETGWIGFLLQCLLYFFILQSGVHAYYRSEKKWVKMSAIAAVVCVFTYIIGQYGQEAIGQVPGCFLFYSCLALIAKAKYLDNLN